MTVCGGKIQNALTHRLGLTPDADLELLLRARVDLDDDAEVLAGILEPAVDDLPEVELHPPAAVLPQLHLRRKGKGQDLDLTFFLKLKPE